MIFSSKQLPCGKWGIYSDSRLLATVASQNVCQTIFANLASGRRDSPVDDVNALYQAPSLHRSALGSVAIQADQPAGKPTGKLTGKPTGKLTGKPTGKLTKKPLAQQAKATRPINQSALSVDSSSPKRQAANSKPTANIRKSLKSRRQNDIATAS